MSELLFLIGTSKKENMKDYVRLVISDLHLGSYYSKEKKLYDLLKSVEFDELILAGDVIDFIKVPMFTKTSYKIFDLLSKLNKKIIYIVGNHDIAFKEFVDTNLLNVDFRDRYDFDYGGRKYRIEHGDAYEKGMVHWHFFMNAFSVFQDTFERCFKFNLGSWYAKHLEKKRKLIRIWDIVKWNDDVDVFIMGHTHKPEVLIWVDANEQIKTYANTGDWIDNCTYILIKDNQLRLRRWK